VLIGLILIAYSYYNFEQAKKLKSKKKSTPEQQLQTNRLTQDSLAISASETAASDSIQANTTTAANDTNSQTLLKSEFGTFANFMQGEEQLLKLENEDVVITFTNKGGNIASINLKHYKTFDKKPLILFENNENFQSYTFYLKNNRDVRTHQLFFETKELTDEQGNSIIEFTLPAGEGKFFRQTYTLAPKGYTLDYKVDISGFHDVISSSSRQIHFEWKRPVRKVEQNKDFENRYTQLHFSYTDKEDETLSESQNEEKAPSTKVRWIAYKQQFFNTTLINKEGFDDVKLKSTIESSKEYIKTFETSAYLPFNHQQLQQYNMQWYLGPNRYLTLKSFDIGLEALIPLGTGIMSWVSIFNKWLIIPIFNFLEKFTSNYGLIILILTLFIKLLLFPLTYKSYKSAALMKVLKPELDALREKYADDQQKLGAEQWKLYQQAGVNPLGGCLPMLLQMPILIAMYYFFPASIELRQESFLWANDLSTYDSILDLPFNIPFYGDHVSLFTLLMTVTSILYAITNNQMMGATQPGMEMMKYMPYIFPILLMGIFNSFPAALTYYYFLQNIISYGQQWAIKKWFIDEDALHRQIQENKKKPVKKSMFQQRLEEMAKQQQKGRGKK
jgi:YidC/Oxa1 family membrane protein insertase